MRPRMNITVNTTSMNEHGAECSTPSLRLFGEWGRGYNWSVFLRSFVRMECLQENVERCAIKNCSQLRLQLSVCPQCPLHVCAHAQDCLRTCLPRFRSSFPANHADCYTTARLHRPLCRRDTCFRTGTMCPSRMRVGWQHLRSRQCQP